MVAGGGGGDTGLTVTVGSGGGGLFGTASGNGQPCRKSAQATCKTARINKQRNRAHLIGITNH
jgi:hypothetical protein